MPVQFQDIQAAAKRIAGFVIESPCPVSIPLSEATGMTIYCKLEYLQRTGSFKERGARNALLQVTTRKAVSQAQSYQPLSLLLSRLRLQNGLEVENHQQQRGRNRNR